MTSSEMVLEMVPGPDAAQGPAPKPPHDADASFPILEITRGLAAGNEAAFNQFYDCYAGRIYGYLLAVLPEDEHLVRDGVQETMLRTIRYVKPCTDEQHFWRWLKRTARTALYDLIRKRNTQHRYLRRMGEDPAFNDLEAGSRDEVEENLLVALRQALDGLKDDERALVEGFYFNNASQSELAAQQESTRSAVQSRLVRIREKLRNQIAKVLPRE